MTNIACLRRCTLAASVIALGHGGVAAAQSTGPETEPATAASAATPLAADPGDIIVTARRSAERLQETPVAVTAVAEAQIRALNLTDSRGLARIAPGLVFTQGATTKLINFAIRGVGSFINSDGFDQSVGVAFDGVPLGRPGGSVADLVDIERVEVLEGPQGMLFGKNASAGLVNIITRRPELDDTYVSGRLSYGSYNELQANATVNLPVSDTFALRGTAWRFRNDGYVTTPVRKIGEKNSGGYRLRALWRPNDRLDVNLFAERTDGDQDPAVSTIRVFTNNKFGLQAREAARGIVPGPGNLHSTSVDTIYNKPKTTSLSGEVSYDLGGPVLTSTTAYRRVRVRDKFDPASIGDAFVGPPAAGDVLVVANQFDIVRYKQFSQEVRLGSAPSSRIKWVVGAIYFDLKLNDFFNFQVFNTVPTAVSLNALSTLQSKHYAGFGELTYPIVDAIRLIAGGRYSKDRISGTLNRTFANPPLAIVPGFNSPGASFGQFAAASKVRDSEWSYRFGVQADVAHDVMLYATASRGYKAAGVDLSNVLSATTFGVNQARVDPEIARNYEVGLRSQFFDRRLTVNATAWHEVFSDFQTSVRLPIAVPAFATTNAKQLKSDGVTLTVDARPVRGLSLSDSIVYTHARYTNFRNAACAPIPAIGSNGSPNTGLRPCDVASRTQILDGFPIANAPKWKNNLTVRYETAGLRADWRLFGQANVRTQSREYFNAAADRNEQQAGFSIVNLTAGFGPEDGRWQLSVYGNNVFNKRFVARTVVQASGLYYVQVVPYDARSRYGVALEFKL